jgi:hypothetical protein
MADKKSVDGAVVDGTEQKRLNGAREAGASWNLDERQRGTVREDYSHDGDATASFSNDQSRSRPSGKRPVYERRARFQDDPHWRDLALFHACLHGDTGAGPGARHQAWWTGLVARRFDFFGRVNAADAPEMPREKLEARAGRQPNGGE